MIYIRLYNSGQIGYGEQCTYKFEKKATASMLFCLLLIELMTSE